MKFPLGRLTATPGVLEAIGLEKVGTLVSAHSSGDWGVCCLEDKVANEHALRDGTRLLSVYVVDDHRIYIITEADRSYTTVLLASEY